MAKEYVIWGKSPKMPGRGERILCSDAKTPDRAVKIIEWLETTEGCTECRVQIFDIHDPECRPDFIGALNL